MLIAIRRYRKATIHFLLVLVAFVTFIALASGNSQGIVFDVELKGLFHLKMWSNDN